MTRFTLAARTPSVRRPGIRAAPFPDLPIRLPHWQVPARTLDHRVSRAMLDLVEAIAAETDRRFAGRRTVLDLTKDY
jgi:hypothetical protein